MKTDPNKMPDDVDSLKTLVTDLQLEVKEKSEEMASYEAEIRSLQRKLAKKDAEIIRQERELHKLRVRVLIKYIWGIFGG